MAENGLANGNNAMNDGNEDIMQYLKARSNSIDDTLRRYLSDKASDQFIEKLLGRALYHYNKEAIQATIIDPAWYLLNLGGKRWRPILMLLIIEALGEEPDNFLEFSIIPEVIHNATLVHDDLEDRSQTRRGSPAVHVKFTEDVAVNLGDALYFFPVAALLDSKKLSPETKNTILSIYVREMFRVTIGQATDIAWHNFMVPLEKITEEDYLQMTYDKSGVLARMACKLGGALVGADEKTIDALGFFGGTIGVAFQIQDDILAITPSKVADSKGGIGDDITEGKITLMVLRTLKKASAEDGKKLLGILKEHTRDKAKIDEAVSIINRYGAIGYAHDVSKKIVADAWSKVDGTLKESEAKRRLKQLADYLITRLN